MLRELKIALAALALACSLTSAAFAQAASYPTAENIPPSCNSSMPSGLGMPLSPVTTTTTSHVVESTSTTTVSQSQAISPNTSILATSVFQQKLTALNQQECAALQPIIDHYNAQISSILTYGQYKTFQGMQVGVDPVREIAMLQSDSPGFLAYLEERLDLTGPQEDALRPILSHLLAEAGPIYNQYAMQEQQLVAVNQEPPVAITTTTTTATTPPSSRVESTTTTPPSVTTPTPKKQVKGTQTPRRFIRNRSMK